MMRLVFFLTILLGAPSLVLGDTVAIQVHNPIYVTKKLPDFNATSCRWPFLASLSEHKEHNWWHEREKGWFFYEKEPEQPDSCKVTLDFLTPSFLRSLTASDFRKLLDELMDYSVSKPTEGNVRAYMLAQWIARERAEQFMTAWSDVISAHPALDYTVVRPPFAYATQQKVMREGARREKFFMNLGKRKDVAIVAFVSPECVYCATQMPIVLKLRDRYGIRIKMINLSEHPDFISRLGIEATPEIWLAVKGVGLTRVTAGLKTLDTIEAGIVSAWQKLTGKSPYEPLWKKEGVEAVIKNRNFPRIREVDAVGGF